MGNKSGKDKKFTKIIERTEKSGKQYINSKMFGNSK